MAEHLDFGPKDGDAEDPYRDARWEAAGGEVWAFRLVRRPIENGEMYAWKRVE